jgi:hypothetical protein
MSQNAKNGAKTLQAEIRRQLGSPPITRFLHSLPAFQVEHATPEQFARLLGELDRAEADQRNSGMNGKLG